LWTIIKLYSQADRFYTGRYGFKQANMILYMHIVRYGFTQADITYDMNALI